MINSTDFNILIKFVILMKRLNTASLLLWILLPPQHVIFSNLLSTPLSATSAMMTCRIILNLRRYGKERAVQKMRTIKSTRPAAPIAHNGSTWDAGRTIMRNERALESQTLVGSGVDTSAFTEDELVTVVQAHESRISDVPDATDSYELTRMRTNTYTYG
jgi:hypothetical protein